MFFPLVHVVRYTGHTNTTLERVHPLTPRAGARCVAWATLQITSRLTHIKTNIGTAEQRALMVSFLYVIKHVDFK